MPQPERGTKRRCFQCGAAYYDLGRDPATCPKCDTPFQVKSAVPLKAFRGAVRISKARVEEEPAEPEAEAENAFAEDEVLPARDDEDESVDGVDETYRE